MGNEDTGYRETVAEVGSETALSLAAAGLLNAIKKAIENGTHKINIYPLHTEDGTRDEEHPALELVGHLDGTVTVRFGRTDIEPISNNPD